MRRKKIKFQKTVRSFVILDDGQLQKPSNSKVSVKIISSKPFKKFHAVWPISLKTSLCYNYTEFCRAGFFWLLSSYVSFFTVTCYSPSLHNPSVGKPPDCLFNTFVDILKLSPPSAFGGLTVQCSYGIKSTKVSSSIK
jgi:hypothetical protein